MTDTAPPGQHGCEREGGQERSQARGGVLLSVVVPARRCGAMLERSLAALRASESPGGEWELIVVDDASGDDTPAVAGRFADLVLRVEHGPRGPRGPAFARNRGARCARGEYIVFVDADVCVHPAALAGFASAFRTGPDVVAVFGAYDAAPAHCGVVSQYRNLLHHYVHVTNAGDAETFWAGCGAVRHSAFLAAGMFDEQRFPRPQIEDIELGVRLRAAGGRILLVPAIQGTHLKRWTLGRMIATDFHDRAVPWTQLLIESGSVIRGGSLNVSLAERVFTALAAVVVLAAGAALASESWIPLVAALAALASVVAGNATLIRWFARQRGVAFALRVIPLRLIFYAVSGAGAAWAIVGHVRRRGLRNRPRPAALAPVSPVR